MRAKNVLDIAFNDVIEKIRGFRRAEIIIRFCYYNAESVGAVSRLVWRVHCLPSKRRQNLSTAHPCESNMYSAGYQRRRYF